MIKPFVPRRMLIPVLPTVYGDSLSYMEFCGKLADKVDEIIDVVNNINLETNSWAVSPQAYGAVGDGNNDDTDALEQCFEDNNLIILNGKYKITRTIHLDNKKNITIVGGQIVRPYNQTFSSFIGKYCRNITFIGTMFDGNGNEENEYVWKDNYQCCFVNEHSSNITFMNCAIQNYNYGCYILGSTEHIDHEASCGAFINCYFKNNTTAIDTYGKCLTVDGCWFEANGDGIKLEPNYNVGHGADITLHSNYYTCGLGLTVQNCTFIGNLTADIRVYKNNYYPKLTNNTHINFMRAIIIQDQIIGAMIRGNTFRNSLATPTSSDRPWSREFSAVSVGSDDTSIIDNVFEYCNVGISVGTNEYKNITIKGNKFLNSKWVNISLYNAHAVIADNEIYGYEADEALWVGSSPITLNHTSEAIIKNNYIESDIQPIYTDGTNSAYIYNNACTTEETSTITTLELHDVQNIVE